MYSNTLIIDIFHESKTMDYKCSGTVLSAAESERFSWVDWREGEREREGSRKRKGGGRERCNVITVLSYVIITLTLY